MALEQETDTILRVLTERTIADRPGCRFDALMAEGIPPGIRSFFRAEIRRKMERDLKRSSWLSEIRQSDAAAARIAQTLLQSLTDAFEFKRQDFLDTLDLAVHFLANYLCRPQWTLENFLFDRSPRISCEDLSGELSYVADFRYLGELALRSLQRRGQTEVSREDFRILVERIDQEIVRQHNARELAALTRPLFQFFQIPGTVPGGGIPVEALLFFFEDKNLRVLKEYIGGICHLRGRTFVTLNELTQLIEDLFAGKPSVQPESAAPAPVESRTPAPDNSPAPISRYEETDAPEPPVPPEPRADGEPPPIMEPLPNPPLPAPPERTVASPESSKVHIALSLTYAGIRSNALQRQVLPELHSLIQPEERDRFIVKVFKGDSAYYAAAILMLGPLKTWKEAETYLGGLYRTNNLDPHAADVAEFSSAIRRRYATIEKET